MLLFIPFFAHAKCFSSRRSFFLLSISFPFIFPKKFNLFLSRIKSKFSVCLLSPFTSVSSLWFDFRNRSDRRDRSFVLCPGLSLVFVRDLRTRLTLYER
jgi:hypothetical protein